MSVEEAGRYMCNKGAAPLSSKKMEARLAELTPGYLYQRLIQKTGNR